MTYQLTKQFNVTDLDDLAVRNMGSASGINVGASLTGASMTSGDSDYKLVQSMDGSNWIDVTGATFADLGNETISVSLTDVFTMMFLGVQMTSVGTETTGTVKVDIAVK